jgi:hypothetical protein
MLTGSYYGPHGPEPTSGRVGQSVRWPGLLCGWVGHLPHPRPKYPAPPHHRVFVARVKRMAALKYRAALKTCGFYNMWMAHAFIRKGSQCFQDMRRPMLLVLAEHIMGTASPNGAGRLRPPAPLGEFIMCSYSIKSIGLPIFKKHWPPMHVKALAIHIS